MLTFLDDTPVAKKKAAQLKSAERKAENLKAFYLHHTPVKVKKNVIIAS
jgi:hypothetical protein